MWRRTEELPKKRVDSWVVTDDFWQREEPLVPWRMPTPEKQYVRKPGAERPPKPAGTTGVRGNRVRAAKVPLDVNVIYGQVFRQMHMVLNRQRRMIVSTSKGFTEANVPDQSGKCFIVTGANTGIGFEITRALAKRGARVLLACRDRAKAEAAMVQIRQAIPRADLAFVPLDQADLASVRAAAELAAKEPRVDALINNAGVMIPPLMRTMQNFELQFGVNHLGTFALTALLLPKLAETKGARVVVTSSVAHKSAKVKWDDLNADNDYNRLERYGASKLANALFFFELDRRLRAAGSPVTAAGCHPGMAATDLMRNTGALQIFLPLLGLMLNTAARGAWPALQAGTGPIEPGGYYGPRQLGGIRGASGEAPRSAEAQDPGLARRLWDVSLAMTGIDPGLPPAN